MKIVKKRLLSLFLLLAMASNVSCGVNRKKWIFGGAAVVALVCSLFLYKKFFSKPLKSSAGQSADELEQGEKMAEDLGLTEEVKGQDSERKKEENDYADQEGEGAKSAEEVIIVEKEEEISEEERAEQKRDEQLKAKQERNKWLKESNKFDLISLSTFCIKSPCITVKMAKKHSLVFKRMIEDGNFSCNTGYEFFSVKKFIRYMEITDPLDDFKRNDCESELFEMAVKFECPMIARDLFINSNGAVLEVHSELEMEYKKLCDKWHNEKLKKLG